VRESDAGELIAVAHPDVRSALRQAASAAIDF
jgi:hypothetical protein